MSVLNLQNATSCTEILQQFSLEPSLSVRCKANSYSPISMICHRTSGNTSISHQRDKSVHIFSDILVLYPPPPPPPFKTRKIHALFPEKIYSHRVITVQTLFSSIKPRFYYISIIKLIYVYYSASYRYNYRAPVTVFDSFFSPLFQSMFVYFE